MTVADIKRGERNYWIAVLIGTVPVYFLVSRWSKPIAMTIAEMLNSVGISITRSNATLVFLVIWFAGVIGAVFLAQAKLLARCPLCRKSFTPNKSGIVIATKNCPQCGARVLTDASNVSAPRS